MDVERIVDRKTIRGRVHYLVVWRGFSDENNTWESRMDLVADGYSNVIREYEDSRKGDDSTSTRGRSPSRGRRSSSRADSPTRGKSPRGRPRGRSNSKARSSSVSRRRSSSTAKTDDGSTSNESSVTTPSRRRSSRAKNSETNEDAPVTTRRESKRALDLSYDATSAKSSKTALSPKKNCEDDGLMQEVPPKPYVEGDVVAGVLDLWKYLSEDGWLLWFFSVLVVVGSLVAARVVPIEPFLRKWIPFVMVVVTLLIVFRQRDSRTSIKWIGVALSFRCAAELLFVIGTPKLYLYGCACAAHLALLVGAFTFIRNREHAQSLMSTILFFIGWLALLLSDNWVYSNGTNPAKHTRGELMVAASLLIALSPLPSAIHED